MRMTSERLLKTGKVSVNINGDFDDETIIEKAQRAERVVDTVWVGESDFFKSPFYVARLILENTSLNVGFGVLRAKNCLKIIEELKRFERYGDRVIVGISAGDGGKIELARDCIIKVKEKFSFPVVAGGTGRKAISTLSEVADGFLFNHISMNHVRWALNHSKANFNSAYGPALIEPSEYFQDLILASALVMGSSKSFLREMGYGRIYREISKVDLFKLISLRQEGEDLSEIEDFRILLNNKDLLLEKFTLYGNLEEFSKKLSELAGLVNQIILSDPFFRDNDFDRKLEMAIKNLKGKKI